MSLNSAVSDHGGEIGRAQFLQAMACRTKSHFEMNPILIKPNSDTFAQIIVRGFPKKDLSALDYAQQKKWLKKEALRAYKSLSTRHEIMVLEGAGSPAEINLKKHDLANMGVAKAIRCPVILIADIDRGGVFAHLIGTLKLLSHKERKLVQGFVINRFRGDLSLLEPGLKWLEKKTKKPILGVLPYLRDLHLDEEDQVLSSSSMTQQAFKVAVIVTPRISNHTDFEPLRLQPQIQLDMVSSANHFNGADLIILAGSKNVQADLAWLKQEGWERLLKQHLRYGGKLIGICGGYQMLGHAIHDPLAIESHIGSSTGLALLDISTTLQAKKTLSQVQGHLNLPGKLLVKGYEIHAGLSEKLSAQPPLVFMKNGVDGCISQDNQILGTYLHGLFDTPKACQALLQWAGLASSQDIKNFPQRREESIERIAQLIDQHLDMKKILDFVFKCPL